MENREDDTIDVEEVLGWAEFCAWSALVMTPIIWWLQGPSVSTDQFVVRTALVVIAAVTGVGLRVLAVIRRRRATKCARQAITTSAARAGRQDEELGAGRATEEK